MSKIKRIVRAIRLVSESLKARFSGPSLDEGAWVSIRIAEVLDEIADEIEKEEVT